MLPVWLYNLAGALSIVLIFGFILLFGRSPARRSRMWTIIVTPLASIIGSGFLVAAPLLYQNFDNNYMAAIITITIFALAVGWAMRTNIQYFEPTLFSDERRGGVLISLEHIASLVLGLAYIIAVAFYLSLLSSFALESIGFRNPWTIRLLTTTLLVFIGGYGYSKGLHGMEGLEKVAVLINLSIIAGLLLALNLSAGYLRVNGFNGTKSSVFAMDPDQLLILGGMLIIVQGFETARYLGKDYSGDERSRGMLIAQLIACAVYIIFVPSAAPLATDLSRAADETAIITIVSKAAWGLAPTLSIAAIFSQFGASVADTVGTGGILEQVTGGIVRRRSGYLIVAGFATLLVWVTDVLTVMTLASRAFALYYALQTVIASAVVASNPAIKHRRLKLVLFPLLVPALLSIVFFAIPLH